MTDTDTAFTITYRGRGNRTLIRYALDLTRRERALARILYRTLRESGQSAEMAHRRLYMTIRLASPISE